MNNLQLLQALSSSLNLQRPTSLGALSEEQVEMLAMIHEVHSTFCGEADWWFLQDLSNVETLESDSGDDCDANTTTDRFLVNDPTAGFVFPSTLANGKFRFGDPGADYAHVIHRVDYQAADTVQSINTAIHPGTITDKAWTFGQDDYTLPSTIDDVSWAFVFSSGTKAASTINGEFLEPVSIEEIESIRGSRADYFSAGGGQPLYYAVRRDETAANAAFALHMIVEPFPSSKQLILLGVKRKPADLTSRVAVVYPDLPVKFHDFIVQASIAEYMAVYGIGAASGDAGPSVPELIQLAENGAAEIKSQISAEARLTAPRVKLDPGSQDRAFYRDVLRRDV